jgi:hypothetical protein
MHLRTEPADAGLARRGASRGRRMTQRDEPGPPSFRPAAIAAALRQSRERAFVASQRHGGFGKAGIVRLDAGATRSRFFSLTLLLLSMAIRCQNARDGGEYRSEPLAAFRR